MPFKGDFWQNSGSVYSTGAASFSGNGSFGGDGTFGGNGTFGGFGEFGGYGSFGGDGYFGGDVTIMGNITAYGDFSYFDTYVTVTSALSVVNHGSTSALTVKQMGLTTVPIATFRSEAAGTVFHITNYGYVGVNTVSPGAALTINGDISANGDFELTGDTLCRDITARDLVIRNIRNYGGGSLIVSSLSSLSLSADNIKASTITALVPGSFILVDRIIGTEIYSTTFSGVNITSSYINTASLTATNLSAADTRIGSIKSLVPGGFVTTDRLTATEIGTDSLTARSITAPRTITTVIPGSPKGGFVHFEVDISEDYTFSTVNISLSSVTSSSKFLYFNGLQFLAYPVGGVIVDVYLCQPVIILVDSPVLWDIQKRWYYRVRPVVDSIPGDWNGGMLSINSSQSNQPILPAPTVDQMGTYEIPMFAVSGTVVFPYEMLATPTVLANILSPPGEASIGGAIIPGTESSVGFDFTLDSSVIALGYKVVWHSRT